MKRPLVLLTVACMGIFFSSCMQKNPYIFDYELKPSVSASVQRVDDPLTFMTFFYSQPEPNRIPSALLKLKTRGLLENDTFGFYITAFLATALREYPEETKELMQRSLRNLYDGRGLDILTYALYAANTDQSYDQLRLLGQTYAPAREIQSTKVKPYLPERIEEANDVFTLWGAFHASGKKEYIDQILEALDENEYRLSAKVLRVRATNAAIDTLVRYCVSDPILLNYCREKLHTVRAAQRYDLNRVIDITDEYLHQVQLRRANPELPMPVLPNFSSPGEQSIPIAI